MEGTNGQTEGQVDKGPQGPALSLLGQEFLGTGAGSASCPVLRAMTCPGVLQGQMTSLVGLGLRVGRVSLCDSPHHTFPLVSAQLEKPSKSLSMGPLPPHRVTHQ